MSILLWLLGILIAIAVSYFLANCFYDIACEKGFDGRKYFWVPFVFGVIGYLLVVALPDRKDHQPPTVSYESSQYRKPTGRNAPPTPWYCPKCNTKNPYDVIRCKCGEPK